MKVQLEGVLRRMTCLHYLSLCLASDFLPLLVLLVSFMFSFFGTCFFSMFPLFSLLVSLPCLPLWYFLFFFLILLFWNFLFLFIVSHFYLFFLSMSYSVGTSCFSSFFYSMSSKVSSQLSFFVNVA